VPVVRRWLASLPRRPRILVEPFAGGAIIGLTAAAESLAERVVLCELDPHVAAVWETILSDDADWLADSILRFVLTRENVTRELGCPAASTRERAFQTILRNRVQRGGIMAPGATLLLKGENGRGIASRWYPETLARRIRAIHAHRDRIEFVRGDGCQLIRRFARHKSAAFFIDPPYTAGGKSAGSRLYACNLVDHARLFGLAARVSGEVMLTYDDAPEVRALAARHSLRVDEIPMKSTHHRIALELVITSHPSRDASASGRAGLVVES
jgi:DNA adenine methylase